MALGSGDVIGCDMFSSFNDPDLSPFNDLTLASYNDQEHPVIWNIQECYYTGAKNCAGCCNYKYKYNRDSGSLNCYAYTSSPSRFIRAPPCSKILNRPFMY